MDPYTHSNNTFIDSNTNSDLSAFFRQGPYQSSTRTFPQPEITWATHSRAINRVDSLWSVVMAWFYDSRHVGNVNKPPLAIDFLTSRRDASVVHLFVGSWGRTLGLGTRLQKWDKTTFGGFFSSSLLLCCTASLWSRTSLFGMCSFENHTKIFHFSIAEVRVIFKKISILFELSN